MEFFQRERLMEVLEFFGNECACACGGADEMSLQARELLEELEDEEDLSSSYHAAAEQLIDDRRRM